MSEIPESVMLEARKQCDLCGITTTSDMRGYAEYVAAFSILSENERCAKIAEKMSVNLVKFEEDSGFRPETATPALQRYQCESIADAIRRR